jgi:hypothetical protein
MDRPHGRYKAFAIVGFGLAVVGFNAGGVQTVTPYVVLGACPACWALASA